MKLSLLPLLACPDCGSDIELAQGGTVVDDDVVGGILECIGCRRSFIIERRFPLLLPKGFDPLQQDQMEIWNSNVDHYDADFALVAFGMVEIPYTIHALDLEPDYNLLDVGCGTGRMTVQLANKVKELICVDYSTKSLTEAEKLVNAASVRNVHFIQGDICRLPLKSMLFSRILCARVLEYLPTEEHQKEAVAELNRCVLPGSTIVVSASQYSRVSKEKFVEDQSGLQYLRFTEEELRELLETSLEIKSISAMMVYLYLATCTGKL